MADFYTDDTIAALATPAGEGGIAVIRLSGPDCFQIAGKVFFQKTAAALASHTIHLGEIRTRDGETFDQALASIFRAPHSYTGEDVMEFSVHGGTALAAKILKLIYDAGARPAQPGEFTRRAFLNGKIDLTQAEAVLDLIKSRSDLSIQAAMSQLGGALSERFKSLKDRLMKLYAHMEAFLDFPEEDLEIYADPEIVRRLEEIENEISKLIHSFQRGSLLREGAFLAIAGKPNVGKSSLFNALLERDRALVSEYAGTTRDTLEEWLEIRGLAIRLADTAGLMQEAAHPLDAMGVERARNALQAAQACLFVVDGSSPLTPEDRLALKAIPEGCPVIPVMNKMDLHQDCHSRAPSSRAAENASGNLKADPRLREDDIKLKNLSWLEVSAKTRQGFEALEEKIFETLTRGCANPESAQITRLRHRQALESALQALGRAREAFAAKASLELVTFDLKQTIDALKELIGEIYSEDLLDIIFSEFCIGK